MCKPTKTEMEMEDEVTKISDASFEEALVATGFGRFHYNIISFTGLAYMYSAISLTILSFVLPSAECDFKMTSADKGIMSAMPMLGMSLGSYFWGCIADVSGRKSSLFGALLLDGFCGILSSIATNYYMFLVLRIFNGFAVTGILTICFPYLGEFMSTAYREKCLCWLECFWTFGLILLPGVAWLIIPLNFNFETPFFFYKSWNLFITLSQSPALIFALWLTKLPETPKYLYEYKRYDETIDIFRAMFVSNSGQSVERFPIDSLHEKAIKISIVQLATESLVEEKPKRSFRSILREIKAQNMELLTNKKHSVNILKSCIIQFGMLCSYYSIIFWLPELFNRYKNFENLNPGKIASVCDLSSTFNNVSTTSVAVKSSNILSLGGGVVVEGCKGVVNTDTYSHTLILGFACLPTSMALPWMVQKFTAKIILVLCLVLSSFIVYALYFVQNSLQNLILSCLFEAIIGCCVGTFLVILVDLFPTNLRVMAGALSCFFGRLGALVGNLLFGYLIDDHCTLLISILGGLLLMSAAFSIFLPQTGNKELD